MSKQIKRILGVLSIGGSFFGIYLTIEQIIINPSILNIMFLLGFCALYTYGLISGVKILEHANRESIKSNLYFWLMQIPILMSPFIGYRFSSGFMVNLWIDFPSEVKTFFSVGSSFQYSLFQGFQPYSIGINLAALVICIYLGRQLRMLSKTELLASTDITNGINDQAEPNKTKTD